MEEHVFDAFRQLIYRESGINLSKEKKPLLMARIQKRLRDLRIDEPDHYLRIVETDRTGAELLTLLDSVSTNVTSFFREPAHFAFLTDHVRAKAAAGQRSLRIWCAASSSGEEPYTIAMCVKEAIADSSVDVKILATDISMRVLERAKGGVYPERDIERVPSHLARRFFSRHNEADVIVSPELRRLLTFARLNLVQQPYPMKGPFEVVFCRNVMIYFDQPTRLSIVKEMERLIPLGGYLILGHSESLMGLDVRFERVGNSIFKRV